MVQRSRGNARPVQQAPPVRRGRKAANPADYADLAPTPYHKAMAKWLVEETGYEPTSRKDFLKAVQMTCDLRNGALGFNAAQTEEEPAEKPVVRRKGAASQATKATAGKTRRAAPVEEPEEEEWEETEDLEEDEIEDEEEDEEDPEDETDDDDDWEDEADEEEPAPAPKQRRPVKKSAPAATRQGAATRKPAAKKAATGRRPKASDEDFTF